MTQARPHTIGIFGGTFDPPHQGHLALARTALDTPHIDELYWIPCLALSFEKIPAPFAHRLAMCRLLTARESRMRVSDIEQTLRHPGRTLELVQRLQAAMPDNAFRLVVGLDIYFERHAWHRFDRLEDIAPPLYAKRAGVPDVPGLDVLEAPPDLRSSHIRAALRRGEPIADHVLHPDVAAYIRQQKLYEE